MLVLNQMLVATLWVTIFGLSDMVDGGPLRVAMCRVGTMGNGRDLEDTIQIFS
jgi:hypothetical protein